ncbi:endolytic transglycosylase MltG [Candidatus Microgenomates bacterium]|nr:endolytic transglycosylase MltG [Candidatus Microgenomates bacterium]
MKKKLLALLLVLGLAIFVWWRFLAPPVGLRPEGGAGAQVFSIKDDTAKIIVAQKLRQEGFIKSELAADLILSAERYPAGGYDLSKSMNVFELSREMAAGPQLLWVVVPPGWRKEQIAEKLQVKFKWTQKDVDDFLSFPEGEYFPDTYLIPRADSGQQVAVRMHNNFNEKFALYVSKFLEANIKNDTALKIASLLQRESGGDDMPLIAGIIWNRLLKGMQLKIDATVQYAKGKVGDQWWSRVSVSDYSSVDSDYNTYLHKGLPPGPIASPGLAAIDAVLNSQTTDCLYYLHDPLGQIHCSPTYEGHLENVEKYLK